MKLKSGYPYYLILYGLPHAYPKLDEDKQCEVVIVGGGISGAIAAYTLQHEGWGCILLDGRSIGLGSTCASTSFLQYEIDVPLHQLIDKIGEHSAVRAYRLCNDSIASLEALACEIRYEGFQTCKSLYFVAQDRDQAYLDREYKARKKVGLAVEWMDENDLEKQYNLRSTCAIRSLNAAHVDAYLFTHHLLQAGVKHGLQVFDRSYVERIKPGHDRIILQTKEKKRITASYAVFATGYEVTEMISKKIVSLRATYATISENMIGSPIPGEDALFWNTSDPYLYLRCTSDNRIVIGGRDEKFVNPSRRDRLIERKTNQLIKDFEAFFPRNKFTAEFSWAGTFGSTHDGLPYIGPYRKYPRCYFALGFGGNGITFSVIAANILSQHLRGKSTKDADIFSFDRN